MDRLVLTVMRVKDKVSQSNKSLLSGAFLVLVKGEQVINIPNLEGCCDLHSNVGEEIHFMQITGLTDGT